MENHGNYSGYPDLNHMDLEPPDSGWAWESITTPETPASENTFPGNNFNAYLAPYDPSQNQTQNRVSISPQESAPAPKVAIPRSTLASRSSRRRRSARACEPCRRRKIKCDGEKPVCRQCAVHHVSCSYSDVKRVQEQKQLESLAKTVEQYERLLEDVESQVDAGSAKRIRKTLKAKGAHDDEDKMVDDEDEASDSSSVGSLDAIDLVDEDLNRNEKSIATGYFGKNSEVSWLKKLENEAERRETESASPESPIYMVNYYLDDLNIPVLDFVQPYDLPPKELADRFFKAYMDTVHPCFNVIRKATFTAQYRQFFSQPSKPPRKWLAILNMIFAIGCRYCRLENESGEENYDDLIYLARARKLSLRGNEFLEHSDLQQVQLEILVALYLLALGQVNRASKLSSMALRSALSLGINLRFVDEHTRFASKEARSRLWWSIYIIEHLITSITGRVSCVGEGIGSVPAPIPFDEESFTKPELQSLLQDSSLLETRLKPTIFETGDETRSNTEWLKTCEPSLSLFFYYVVDLTLLTQAVINQVYSIQGSRDRNTQLEARIRKYGAKMDDWLSKLHDAYQFTSPTGTFILGDQEHTRERICFAMQYYSARITLNRPCLTHTIPSHSPSSSPNAPPSHPSTYRRQSSRSLQRTDLAISCLRSACSLISILPNNPDTVWLLHVSPWWSLLHYLMQATTALLLGLSSWPIPLTPPHPPSSPHSHFQPEITQSAVITSSKKALRWLHKMASANAASRRAYTLCDSFMRRIAPSVGVELGDLPDSGVLPVMKGLVQGEFGVGWDGDGNVEPGPVEDGNVEPGGLRIEG